MGDHPVLQRGESHNSINSISSQESREHKIPRTSKSDVYSVAETYRNRCFRSKLYVQLKWKPLTSITKMSIFFRGTPRRKALSVLVD